jgi:thiamine pyrophosphokinase
MRKVVIVTHIAQKNSILKYSNIPLIGVGNGVEVIARCNLPIALGIGNFDTLDYQNVTSILKPNQIVRLNNENNISEVEGAVDYMQKLGFDEMVILSSLKERYDITHQLLLLTKKYPNCKITIEDENNSVTYLKKGSHVIQKQDFKYVGLFGFPEAVISVDNSQYKSKKMKLSFTDTKSISNSVLDRVIEMEVYKGGVLLVLSKESN